MKNCKEYLDYIRSIDRNDVISCACDAKDRAQAVLAYSAEQVRRFSLFDFAVFKLCLLSLGLWLGARFSCFFGKFKHFIFAGFIASYVYLIWRIFFRAEE